MSFHVITFTSLIYYDVPPTVSTGHKPDEYQASDSASGPILNIVKVPNLPPNAKLLAAWWAPAQTDLTFFPFIDVDINTSNQVVLTATGSRYTLDGQGWISGTAGAYIKIYVMYEPVLANLPPKSRVPSGVRNSPKSNVPSGSGKGPRGKKVSKRPRKGSSRK